VEGLFDGVDGVHGFGERIEEEKDIKKEKGLSEGVLRLLLSVLQPLVLLA
jgi:hypothetical protein